MIALLFLSRITLDSGFELRQKRKGRRKESSGKATVIVPRRVWWVGPRWSQPRWREAIGF